MNFWRLMIVVFLEMFIVGSVMYAGDITIAGAHGVYFGMAIGVHAIAVCWEGEP